MSKIIESLELNTKMIEANMSLIGPYLNLDLRKEKDEDYPSGYLLCLKQLDSQNHRSFIMPDDCFGERCPKGFKVLGSLVDLEEWKTLTGKVAVILTNGFVDYGLITENSLAEFKVLVLHSENDNCNCKHCHLENIVAVYHLETIISGSLISSGSFY